MGAAYIFTASLVFGAVLGKGPGSGSRRLGWRPIVSVLVIRLVLVPIIGEWAVFCAWQAVHGRPYTSQCRPFASRGA